MAARIEVNGREFFNIVDMAVALAKCERQEEKDEYLLAIKHLDKWNREHFIKTKRDRDALKVRLKKLNDQVLALFEDIEEW